MDITFRCERYTAGHPLVLMQGGTLFGMNVALSPATFANVPAIPRSPLRASFASLYIVLCALSPIPQKVRLEEYKHIAEKERWSEKNTPVGFDHVTL